MKEKKIPTIKQGVVIDHIPRNRAIDILGMLKLDKESEVRIGINFHSKKFERKDVIKIENKEPTTRELKKIAVIAQDATISTIRNYKVKEKIKLKLDKEIVGVVKCANLNCITNQQGTRTRFEVEETKPLKLKCHYCEKSTLEEDIELR